MIMMMMMMMIIIIIIIIITTTTMIIHKPYKILENIALNSTDCGQNLSISCYLKASK